MTRQRLALATVRWLSVLVFTVVGGQVPPVAAAMERDVATAQPDRSLLETTPLAGLSDRDIDRYRRIFELQEHADWERADELIARLEDRVLLGHVLYQRYMHPTGYRSQFAELSAWLDEYADHPDADRVYRLALRRRPDGTHQPQNPVRGYLAGAGQELQERGEIRHSSAIARAPSALGTLRLGARGSYRPPPLAARTSPPRRTTTW